MALMLAKAHPAAAGRLMIVDALPILRHAVRAAWRTPEQWIRAR